MVADMESISVTLLVGAGLVALSILAGAYATRLGAPVLLIFLVLGMLAGQDGPGGIVFDDFHLTYMVGSVALAVILFDGGLRTTRTVFRLALWPGLSLATVGVLVTAAIVAVVAYEVLSFGTVEGLLLGGILASTDAAAVFLLLSRGNRVLNQRVQATLEAESGMNDPMAVFLTISCVEWLLQSGEAGALRVALSLVLQMAGGAAFGLLGGWAMRWLIDRVELAVGLYPILVAAGALVLFSAANVVGASGFLAVYLAGIVMGSKPFRAQQMVIRFHDGLVWLAQVVMFLLLGLLVTPTEFFPLTVPALVIALVLMLVARPVAVLLSLLPFRFDRPSLAFISWVGLRGAVPIFLGCLPVLAGLPNGRAYFDVAFVMVLLSLVVQGWTAPGLARALGLEVPAAPEPEASRLFELPDAADRDILGWRVVEDSSALEHSPSTLPLPPRTGSLGVVREGRILPPTEPGKLEPDDYVILLVPPEQRHEVDKLFAPASAGEPVEGLGEFMFDPSAPFELIAKEYGLPFPADAKGLTVGDWLARRIGRLPVVGDRVKLAPVELTVRATQGDRITLVGLELEEARTRLPLLRWLERMRRKFGGGTAKA
ncbi:K(+)/H(+) antiporter NhaP2 [Hypericibacter adhaerens]|jgi:cell volume regulation protein A|uniref:K(+)/H(+) antiporter NhaP2 n=2 Tax=Hypericibacter adhaerens TaxID=2602016 RepID=A0A5J6N030_9PROT|nr:K(+)/H(+) antiporter NhaP2 [Hypericibacter adhaerens]